MCAFYCTKSIHSGRSKPGAANLVCCGPFLYFARGEVGGPSGLQQIGAATHLCRVAAVIAFVSALAAARVRSAATLRNDCGRRGFGEHWRREIGVSTPPLLLDRSEAASLTNPKRGASLDSSDECSALQITAVQSEPHIDSELAALKGLQICIDTIMAEVERVLATEQSATDFKPAEHGNASDNRPISACIKNVQLLRKCKCDTGEMAGKVIAYMEHMLDAGYATLEGLNKQAFLTELGNHLNKTLLMHWQRFTFSVSGGLRLKRDVAEFIEFVRIFKAPAVDEKFELLITRVNVLILVPESLPTLIESSLNEAREEAVRKEPKTDGASEPMDDDKDEEDGDGGSAVGKKDPSVRRKELLSKSGLAKVSNRSVLSFGTIVQFCWLKRHCFMKSFSVLLTLSSKIFSLPQNSEDIHMDKPRKSSTSASVSFLVDMMSIDHCVS